MKSTVLIHGGALGDFVLALRLIAGLERSGANIVIIARGMHAPIVAEWPNTRFMDIERGPVYQLFGADPFAGLRAAGVSPDSETLILDMTGTSLSDSASKPAKCNVVPIDPKPIPGDVRHITEQWAAKIRAFGVRCSPKKPESPTCATATRAISDTPIVLIHPGSGGESKCWPFDSFFELAERVKEIGTTPRFIIGPVEVEKWPPALSAKLQALYDLAIATELPALVAEINAASVFVGNDSGPTHLAASLDVSTVAIFGPTNPDIWCPPESIVPQQPRPGDFPKKAAVIDSISSILSTFRSDRPRSAI